MNQRTPLRAVISHFRRIVVVRSLEGLGDFLCIVPTLRSLRTALPQATITLVGLPKTRLLVQRFHQYVDELLPFPGYPGLPEQDLQLQQLPAFFETAQNQCFDLALQLHGSGTIINPLIVLFAPLH